MLITLIFLKVINIFLSFWLDISKLFYNFVG